MQVPGSSNSTRYFSEKPFMRSTWFNTNIEIRISASRPYDGEPTKMKKAFSIMESTPWLTISFCEEVRFSKV